MLTDQAPFVGARIHLCPRFRPCRRRTILRRYLLQNLCNSADGHLPERPVFEYRAAREGPWARPSSSVRLPFPTGNHSADDWHGVSGLQIGSFRLPVYHPEPKEGEIVRQGRLSGSQCLFLPSTSEPEQLLFRMSESIR
jgi:hypothetical protein